MTKTVRNENVSVNNAVMSCCIAYVIYMIMNDYMYHTCLVTKKAFDKCRKCYEMLDESTRIKIESLCIDFIEDDLLSQLPEGFRNQDFKVSIRYMEKTQVQAVVFENEDNALWMSAKPTSYPFFITGVFLKDNTDDQEQPAAA